MQVQEREQNRLEQAFEDQYKPPPGCSVPQSDSRWAKCVDIRRKAKGEYMGRQVLLSAPHEDIPIVEKSAGFN